MIHLSGSANVLHPCADCSTHAAAGTLIHTHTYKYTHIHTH
jgi:hypothetical protein